MRKFIRRTPTRFSLTTHCKVKDYDSVKNEIRKELLELSQNHCSYCDLFFSKELLSGFTPHIEHFKPKSYNNLLEDNWLNHFVSCQRCNASKKTYNNKTRPYNPAAVNYKFAEHFDFDYNTGEIKPFIFNKSKKEIERAKETIHWLGLNKGERPNVRKSVLNQYIEESKTEVQNIDEWSFRDFIDNW